MMQVNPSPLLTKTMTLSDEERRKIPGAYETTLSIFEKHVPEIGLEPLDIQFTAQKIENNTKALVDAAKKLQKAEQLEKKHKILSIVMLAVTVSLIAGAILLAAFGSSISIPLLTASALTSVLATNILQIFCTKDPQNIPIFIAAEINYINKAFRHPNPKPPSKEDYQARIDTNTEKLKRDLVRLQLIRLHQDTIRDDIKQELRGFDLTDYSRYDDVQRIDNLRNALQTLDDLMTSCEKIQ